ncbi:unnamed protein product, partial [Brassica oleracea var. botrytis]
EQRVKERWFCFVSLVTKQRKKEYRFPCRPLTALIAAHLARSKKKTLMEQKHVL